MIRTQFTLTLGLAIAAFHSASLAADKSSVDLSKLPPPAVKQGVTYATDVKPVFDKSCVRCHGAEKPKGKLRLDTLEGALKGGEAGKILKPGDSAGSMVVLSVAHLGDPDGYMPPLNNKAGIQPLTPQQVGLLRAWIDQGAK